jgi:hypothetical protein
VIPATAAERDRPTRGGRRLTIDKSVTHRDQRLNLTPNRTELPAKPTDVNIDRAVVDRSSPRPNVLKQFLPGDNTVLALHEVFQDLEFEPLQHQRFPSTLTYMSPKFAAIRIV